MGTFFNSGNMPLPSASGLKNPLIPNTMFLHSIVHTAPIILMSILYQPIEPIGLELKIYALLQVSLF